MLAEIFELFIGCCQKNWPQENHPMAQNIDFQLNLNGLNDTVQNYWYSHASKTSGDSRNLQHIVIGMRENIQKPCLFPLSETVGTLALRPIRSGNASEALRSIFNGAQ